MHCVYVNRMMWAAGAVAAMSSITFPAVSALVSQSADPDKQGDNQTFSPFSAVMSSPSQPRVTARTEIGDGSHHVLDSVESCIAAICSEQLDDPTKLPERLTRVCLCAQVWLRE